MGGSGIVNDAALGYLSVLTHPVLDVFSGYTPVFWPLYGRSLWVESSLLVQYGSLLKVELLMEIHSTPTRFRRAPVFTGVVISGGSFMISAILVAALLYRLYCERTGNEHIGSHH